MRILRVAQKLYPSVKGGGAYHVHAMSRDQAASGHDVTVLTIRRDESDPIRERRSGYSVVRKPATVDLIGNEMSVGLARQLVDISEYDVMHAHSHLYFSTNLAAVRRKLGGVPLAVTNHGLYSQNVSQSVFDIYLKTVGKWTFNAADVIFCYTEVDRDRLRQRGVTAPVEVVHNGVDMERFSPEGETHSGVTGEPAVLFVGRLVEGKRPADALAGVARLRDSFPDARVTFCGRGPMRDSLADRAEALGIREAVTFLGHVPYDDMPAVYRAADALVLPSRAEGMPRTVLEAMAAGVPVVTSDLEQVRSVITAGGETASVGSPLDIANRLRAVLSDPTTYDPRSVVRDDHDWDKTVEQTTATLRRLVKDAGSAHLA